MSALIIAIVVFALVVVMWFIGESNRLNRYQVMIEDCLLYTSPSPRD